MKKFELIYAELKQRITTATWVKGRKIPSESQLCSEFQCSRGTLRKALELLAQDGLINAQHGKGVFVLDHEQITFSFGSLVSFGEANLESDNRFSTAVVSFDDVSCSAELAKITNFSNDSLLNEIVRVRYLGGERVIVDHNYFNSRIIAGLTKVIAEKSIYNYIEQSLGLKIGFARRTIEVAEVQALDRANLDLKNFPMVAVVKNWVYLHDGQLFEYTESHHRPDRFIFNEFVRRK